MKVTFNMSAVKERIESAGQKAVFIVAQQALKDCNYYCKQDTSELIDSSILHSDFEKGILIWQTPYARYQYYLDDTRKDKNPNASKMWAHVAYAKHKKEWFDVMKMLSEILQRSEHMFSEMLEKITEIADIDNISLLSENGGTSAEIAPSSSLSRYLDGSSSDVMSVLILSKHKNQKTALDKLFKICNALTRQKNISTDKLIAYGITVATQPNYVAKENNMWIYSCIVNFNIYNKEEF